MEHERIKKEFLAGTSPNAHEYFGAHLAHEYGKDGVRFTVFAPHARNVSVIGSFNSWRGYEMHREKDGVFTIFVDDAKMGDLYKYRIETTEGRLLDKADSFAFYSEVRPGTASIVWDMENFPWNDGEWMKQRNKNYNRPLSIYEMHAGSWKFKDPQAQDIARLYNYEELADHLIPYLKEMGYTHLELLPLCEHPFDGSWGYQVTGYFSATSRYGDPRKLMQFVNLCHQNNIGVIFDFVPVHFAGNDYALAEFDGKPLYETAGQYGRYSEWGTVLFDYSKPYVRSFVLSALDFWCEKFHADGIRYDAVSHLIYQEGKHEGVFNRTGIAFLRSANTVLERRHPAVMKIAEDSSAFIKVTAPVKYDGLGFDYKWNLGWMNDTLSYLALPPDRRGVARKKIIHSIDYFYQDLFLLPLSHDEVVHGKHTILDKIAGSYEEKFAQLRSLYLFQMVHPGKTLSFMGNELAEFKEWDESKELGWNILSYPAHDGFYRYFARLLHFYRENPALYTDDYHPGCFRWLESSSKTIFCFERMEENGQSLLCAVNFGTDSLLDMEAPRAGDYCKVFSTAGEGECEKKGHRAKETDDGYRLSLRLEPFESCVLERKRTKQKEKLS